MCELYSSRYCESLAQRPKMSQIQFYETVCPVYQDLRMKVKYSYGESWCGSEIIGQRIRFCRSRVGQSTPLYSIYSNCFWLENFERSMRGCN
jgi:hypothetical protein